MRKPGLMSTTEERAAYWNAWLSNAEEILTGSEDYLQRSIYEVTKVAIDNKQYAIPDNEFEEVDRLIRIRIRLTRDEIKRYYGIDTYSVYGVGIYILMKGIILTSATRDQMRYDEALLSKKWSKYDLSNIPANILSEYEFGLAIPALGGLFVPRKTRLTSCFHSIKCLQYYDIMKN